MNSFLLFIDDERDPPNDGNEWNIVRSSADAKKFCANGVPSYISFDHDLGGDDTAMVFIKWMIENDLDHLGFIPADFHFTVHSQNPIGKANIEGLLTNYLQQRDSVI